ncbi:MAG: Exopolysaccharide biosynthesis glycosyltransferase EpsF [uncultured Thiotrichaceae bacterium]|uniref:Exopolysaccharide biosynthesis glycosyltransferase EpsF n=1 Tax=uncultured Thiotrichaceae bacterium TaxID=298394 RepID=A0A6S6U0P5_9GAMM|nr:MAG: Exopolysaccharide biosynthesis glycosyltransferase EpsF [uncultured Thiotrichaceae bacterium]
MKKIESGNVNIVIMITKGDIGGAQIHVKDLAVSLQEFGNRVTVFVGEKDTFTDMLEGLNIHYRIIENLVREINPIRDVKAYREIRGHLKDIQPDLVSLHSSKAGILGRLIAAMNKIPATFTAHGWAFTDGVDPKKQFLYAMIERVTALLPARIIAVSHYDRGIALKHKVCKAEKVVAVQNGMPDISPDLFAEASRAPPRIIMVARFKSPKDHEALVDALNELKELPWELILVGGDGGTQAAVEAKIVKLGLQEKINILGYRSDIDKLIASSQLFVLISRWEGFPLSILEAMRAKLPIIASNVGGVGEMIIDGQTGYLVNNHDELVAQLKILVGDPEKRTQMGLSARESYQKSFTLKVQLDKTFKIYNELLVK